MFTYLLTPPAKFPGWKVHGRPCKQCIFPSCNIYLCVWLSLVKDCTSLWKSFPMPVSKGKQRGLRVSNLALLLVVFKWHHGSEGVKSAETNRDAIVFFCRRLPFCFAGLCGCIRQSVCRIFARTCGEEVLIGFDVVYLHERVCSYNVRSVQVHFFWS